MACENEPLHLHGLAVLAMIDSMVDGWVIAPAFTPVQRCDQCGVYGDDEQAAKALAERLGTFHFWVENEEVIQYFVKEN